MPGGATARGSDRAVLRLLGTEVAEELAGRVISGRQFGREREERRHTAFPTGLPVLDQLLAAGSAAHGLPRGCLVELVGRASSGRFAVVLSTLATTTTAGEAAALVDLGDHLDPTTVTDSGADPERLLWVRPRDLREALAATETILAGGLPLVVVDLGLPPVRGGRGAEASWLRLARVTQAHGAALLVSAPYRVSGTAAHAVVVAETASGLYAGGVVTSRLPLLQGLALRFGLEKLRGHRPGAVTRAELLLSQAHLESGLVASRRRTGAPERDAVVRRFPGGRPSVGEAAAAAGRLATVTGPVPLRQELARQGLAGDRAGTLPLPRPAADGGSPDLHVPL